MDLPLNLKSSAQSRSGTSPLFRSVSALCSLVKATNIFYQRSLARCVLSRLHEAK